MVSHISVITINTVCILPEALKANKRMSSNMSSDECVKQKTVCVEEGLHVLYGAGLYKIK